MGWDGTEIVAFRLHLPARIRFHNAPSHRVERGNILEWEQSLADRLKGVPIRMEARMDQESILYTTRDALCRDGRAGRDLFCRDHLDGRKKKVEGVNRLGSDVGRRMTYALTLDSVDC